MTSDGDLPENVRPVPLNPFIECELILKTMSEQPAKKRTRLPDGKPGPKTDGEEKHGSTKATKPKSGSDPDAKKHGMTHNQALFLKTALNLVTDGIVITVSVFNEFNSK